LISYITQLEHLKLTGMQTIIKKYTKKTLKIVFFVPFLDRFKRKVLQSFCILGRVLQLKKLLGTSEWFFTHIFSSKRNTNLEKLFLGPSCQTPQWSSFRAQAYAWNSITLTHTSCNIVFMVLLCDKNGMNSVFKGIWYLI
jgi:hypothetical protein